MPKQQEAPSISEWDWVGTSEAMIERIRPKARYERAIVCAAVILVLGFIVAATQFRAPKPPRYEFLNVGSYVKSLTRLRAA